MFRTLAASLLALPSALAQEPTPLVETGDSIPGVGLVTQVDRVTVNSSGDWLVALDTDAAPNHDACVVANGALALQEGTGLGLPPTLGAELERCRTVALDENGVATYLVDVADPNGHVRRVVVWNGLTLIEEAVTVCPAATLLPGTRFDAVDGIAVNENRRALVVGDLSNGRQAAVLVHFDAAGTITSANLLAMEGTVVVLPGHTLPVTRLGFEPGRIDVDAAGTPLWFVEEAWNQYFAHRGTATLASTPAGTLSGWRRFETNDAGGWILDVVTGSGVSIQPGLTLPSVPGGYPFLDVSSSTRAFLGNDGRVVYQARWDSPDADTDTGIFFEEELLVQEGVSTIGGRTIDELPFAIEHLHASDDGNRLGAILRLDDGTQGAYLYGLPTPIGATYCTAVPNSTGSEGTLEAFGSLEVANGDVRLVAGSLPQNVSGLFVASRTQGFLPAGASSNGNLCLAGSIGRFLGLGQVGTSGAAGMLALEVPLSKIPEGAGLVSVLPGETWNFQAWHRDTIGLGSNLTRARTLTFQ